MAFFLGSCNISYVARKEFVWVTKGRMVTSYGYHHIVEIKLNYQIEQQYGDNLDS